MASFMHLPCSLVSGFKFYQARDVQVLAPTATSMRQWHFFFFFGRAVESRLGTTVSVSISSVFTSGLALADLWDHSVVTGVLSPLHTVQSLFCCA